MALNNQINLANGEQRLSQKHPAVPMKPTKLQKPQSSGGTDLINWKAPVAPPKSVSDKRLANCEAALQALSNVVKNCPGIIITALTKHT